MRFICLKCPKPAVWNYSPSPGNRYFCDDHVPRGCSCNWDEATQKEDTDEQGRLLPYCEFDYNEKGFNPDDYH